MPLCRETQLLLEQLERLRSVDTPPHATHPPPTPPPMITIDSYWIKSQNKTKLNLQILGICQKFKFFNFENKYDTSEVAW